VIVRISTEGQFRLDDEAQAALNELDNAATLAVAQGDEAGFRTLFGKMLDLVRERGTPVAAEELVSSDIVLPPPDLTFEEARSLFREEGLIPG